ncbi:MAG: three-Cys-motif partner protein TcmP [Bryobacterales bacterium]|nr:three-Cys-motif partner protein TcmP [Bryobacterales bacterium]
MSTNNFFEESREQSAVKTAIVSKYFWSWAQIIMRQAIRGHAKKIAYLDLFAGPGRYDDGTKSTPLLILEKAIADEQMSQMLVTVFNDKDDYNAKSLQTAIDALPGIDKLKFRPDVWNKQVGVEMVKVFSSMKLVPTLFFVDPWGYKGLSLQLINSVLKDWGCDCIFFFNYNRINMGMTNDAVREHMEALFGQERAARLREKLETMSSADRENCIVEELCKALEAGQGRYVLPFCFKNDSGARTSHHLIFVSKHVLGYSIMKEIMAKESSLHEQGVPSFQYRPADKRFPLLFELNRPLDELEELLLQQFAGQSLQMKEIYERHHVGRRFIAKNYKDALKNLEEKKSITCEPPKAKRRKDSFADNVWVTFPPGGKR